MDDAAANIRNASIKLAQFRQSTIEGLVDRKITLERLDTLLKAQAAMELLQKLQSGEAR